MIRKAAQAVPGIKFPAQIPGSGDAGSYYDRLSLTIANPDTPADISGGPDTAPPEVRLLSNGSYDVMVTNAGGGCRRRG